MMVAHTFLLLCQLSFYGLGLTAPPSTLVQVNVVYRHGDRGPTSIYPKDNNQLDAWPDGLAWLTNIGKMQQYKVGQYLEQKYNGFINTTHYNHREIMIQSSCVERCLMSAYSNLAGLFPPQGSQIWNPSLIWQPIPVQTTPKVLDNKLAQGAPCPRYDQLKREVMSSPEVKKEDEANKDFYDMVEENTGIVKLSLADIWEVADTLICEKAHNLTWNDWALKPNVWNKLDDLRTKSFDLLYAKPEMAKLKGGPLLQEIITNMNSSTIPGTQTPKFFMYSAHDTTVASLLSAMRTFNCHQPVYRALIMIELHKMDHNFEVRILYRNDTTQDPYQLSPPGCDSPCTLDKFIEVTKPYVPVNWSEECKIHKSTWESSGLSPGYEHCAEHSLQPQIPAFKLLKDMDTEQTTGNGTGSSGNEADSPCVSASWIALAIGLILCLGIVAALFLVVFRLHRKHSAAYSRI